MDKLARYLKQVKYNVQPSNTTEPKIRSLTDVDIDKVKLTKLARAINNMRTYE